MDILSEVYFKGAAENERNRRFWENYLQSLKGLDFSFYSDKLKVATLVPIGSRILFRGELKHTNEVIVSLGADYFVKCSLKQAEELRQHRIRDAQSKVDIFNKEKEYLEKQMSFTKKTVSDDQGQEIIEYYSEEDDKAWRQKHRENVRQYKQKIGKEDKNKREHVTDEEFWNRLEELELQEELENELSNSNDDVINYNFNKFIERREKPFVVKKEDYINIKNKDNEYEKRDQEKGHHEIEIKPKKVTFKENQTPEQTSKDNLLQQVIDKQNELEEKLFELKNRERSQSKSESDVMSRLDELEQLDELEDEMDRLDDIIENEDVEEDDDDSNKTQAPKLQKRVSFVDDDDSETVEINFEHSPVESYTEPYNPNKGIEKPSDIYQAHTNLFGNGTTSILKKSKYDTATETPEIKVSKEKVVQFDVEDSKEPETIVIKDVIEKVYQADPKLLSQARPTSLFKKKRMQNKS